MQGLQVWQALTCNWQIQVIENVRPNGNIPGW